MEEKGRYMRRVDTVKIGIGSFLSAFVLAAMLSASGWAAEVWVTNMKSGDVYVIDPASLEVVATIPTGKGAHNVTISADGRLAFVANVGANSVTIIDAVAKTVLGNVATGTKTHDV